jgi:hypothetical protein
LTDSSGNQAVHIAPEAFQVASAEFPDEIDVWQKALPGGIKGGLASVCFCFLFLQSVLCSTSVFVHQLSGARVITINGKDPNVAVDANAKITGSFQGLGTRQNS